MIKVLHYPKIVSRENGMLFKEEEQVKFAEDYLGIYYHVADVSTDSLDTAFKLTNHIDQDWSLNDQVNVVKQSRSTSVGDVLLVNDEAYVVASVGFAKINAKNLHKDLQAQSADV